MEGLLTISLEAHSDELNRHRRYEIAVGRDLLEHWTVTVRYGRVGSPVRELRFGSPDADRAQRIVHDRLKRRLSAPRRIGCSYRLRELRIEKGLDVGTWLPSSFTSQFLTTLN